MALNEGSVLGRTKQVYVQRQLSSESYPAFTQPDKDNNTGNSELPRLLAALSTSMSFAQERKNRGDANTASRDYSERITGSKTVGWSVKHHIVVPDQTSAATIPDWSPLLELAMGATVATSGAGPYVVTWALSHTNTGVGATIIRKDDDDLFMESVWGALVEEVDIEIAQGSDPTITYSGFASDYAATGVTAINDGTPSGTSTTVDDGTYLSVNSVVKIGSDDATSDFGHKITAITGNAITLAESLTGVSDNAAVIPYVDSGITSTGGTVLAGVDGQLDIGSDTDVPILAFKLKIKNNYKEVREAFKAAVQEAIPGRRLITGSITVELHKTQTRKVINRLLFWQPTDIVVRCGGTATGDEKMTITINTPEFDFSDVQWPDTESDDVATVELPFTALASSATATDAVSIAVTTT